MANHCNNFIEFVGPHNKIVELTDYINRMYWSEPSESTLLRLEEMVEPDQQMNYKEIVGARWFEVSTLFLNNEDVLKSDTSSIEEQPDGESCLQLYGDSAWSPVNGLMQILAKKYGLTAVNQYEEGQSFYGRAEVSEDGILTDECYDFWEGVAILDEGDYIERANNEIEAQVFENLGEFLVSDLWNYCPEGLQEEVRSAFFSYISEQEDNELSAKSSTDVR